MKESKASRFRIVGVRLTADEWAFVHKELLVSDSKKLSDHVRKKILGKPVAVYHRNLSLDEFMTEMIQLRKELNAIGNNYNQVVKRLHSMYNYDELNSWLKIHESSWQLMQKKVNEIKAKINQINEQWLR